MSCHCTYFDGVLQKLMKNWRFGGKSKHTFSMYVSDLLSLIATEIFWVFEIIVCKENNLYTYIIEQAKESETIVCIVRPSENKHEVKLSIGNIGGEL